MGSSFAKKLKGFDCTILAYDKYKTGFGTLQFQEVSLEELKAKSDIISIHLPLTTETHYYVNTDFINSAINHFT
jgi:D-3-phosphoglycerate dehydrogenase